VNRRAGAGLAPENREIESFQYFRSIALFTVSVETQFKAGHSVALPDGSKEPEHEHFWAVSVEVSSDKLNGNGVVMDFARLKSELTGITSKLGGGSLNDVDYFREHGPSAENVAVYIFQRLEPNLPDGVRLESVSVSEQVGCSAKYSAD
jgi:6-pyruvoyltetrahydropterin/6-carboxytetrahydropterin synthase